ncbi:protein PIN-LIKES 5-like isoform X3 [Andrographis paniculata]|uniref:protein PIN-LIKES 5-like isoform X3 n=1 Tax=Andrographis paniculata TaxID=175694 RepID=UPI0021E94756|nr:protein PIN-LIKES 5-like isoform X3 [Andrographis paniculata]
MGLWSLLEVSSMPILQLLIISLLGAAMATQYLNLLPPHACKSLNRIVFVVFTPALIFASLAKTVHFQDIISWWFMAANIGITFLVGGILGWIAVKILKPQPYLQDLIIAMCATGNFANILLVIIPAICSEDGSPFGDKTVCRQLGLSYVSFSMAIGSFYTWTYTYHLIQSAKAKYCAMLGNADESSKEANNGTEANETASLLLNLDERVVIPSNVAGDDKIILDKKNLEHSATLWTYTSTIFHRLAKELKAPPVLAAGWNYSLHNFDLRWQLNSRDKQGTSRTNGGDDSDRHKILDTSRHRNFCRESSFILRLPSLGPSLPLYFDDSICASTRDKYRYNDTTI